MDPAGPSKPASMPRSRKRAQTFRAQAQEILDKLHPVDYETINETSKNANIPELRSSKKPKMSPETETRMQSASDLYIAGQWREALEAYANLVEGHRTAAVISQMVSCHLFLGDKEKALELAGQLVGMDKTSIAAWQQYLQLAEDLEKDGQVLDALKGLVELKDVPENTRHDYLSRIVHILEVDSDPADKLKYVQLLLPLEMRNCSMDKSIQLHVSIAKLCLQQKQPEEAIKVLGDFVQFMLSHKNSLCGQEDGGQAENIRPAIMLLLTAFLDCNKPDDATSLIVYDAEIVEIFRAHSSGILERIFDWRNAEEVKIKEEYAGDLGLMAAICTALFLADQRKLSLVVKIIGRYILANTKTPANTNTDAQKEDTEQLTRLSKVMLNHDHPTIACDIMDYTTTIYAAVCTIDTHYLTGTIHETCSDVPAATKSYGLCLTKQPDFRPAKVRLDALEMEFPNTLTVLSDTVKQEILLEQFKAYVQYVECQERGRMEGLLVDSVVRMVEKTFDGAAAIEPGNFLWALHTPYALEKGLKKYLLPAPVLAEKKVQMGEFWKAVVDGCRVAFQLKRYDDMITIAFNAVRTWEIACASDPGKMDLMKEAIIVAAFYLPPRADPDPLTGTVVDTKKFSYDYLREQLNRLRQNCDFSVHRWNLFYHLATNPEIVEAGVVVKWATHWIGKNGYKMEVSMVLANDSMRRGSYPHAHKLYLEIVDKEGEANIPWIVWLHLGILNADLACRFRVPDTEKRRLYAECNAYLDKYAAGRGMCPEVMYNRARACHLFGDTDRAVEYYKGFLQLVMHLVQGLDEENGIGGCKSMVFEAAYNLRCLYVHQKKVEAVENVKQSMLNWTAVKKCASGITFSR